MEQANRHLFITGRAGTGKSTLLDHFRKNTTRRVVVLAPTGVAALNVSGQTIHSFFGFKPNMTLEQVHKLKGETETEKKRLKTVQELDLLIIDEISMVRADLMDCVEKFLRLNGPERNRPFGGVKLIFFGDLFQLPPVVTPAERFLFEGGESLYQSPYFFAATALANLDLELLELTQIFRQQENQFIEALNTIRDLVVDQKTLSLLNSRYLPDYQVKAGEFTIHLTATNEKAREINALALSKLPGKIVTLKSKATGSFNPNQSPSEELLELKEGAQVMLLVNDPSGQYVNGSLGKVIALGEELKVKLDNGKKITLSPFTWEVFNYTFNEQTGQIETEPTGSFTQYPLKLAWAVTIHKAQGKTFDRVVIDVGRGTFAHGQLYVALSRCKSLEGIILKQPVETRHVIVDKRVSEYLRRLKLGLGQQSMDGDWME